MIYVLSCRDEKTGECRQFSFDSQNNRIFQEDGREIDFSRDSRFVGNPRFARHESALAFSSRDASFKAKHSQRFAEGTEFAYSPENPLCGKSRRVAKLRIQLGLACNYRCRYCLQSAARSSLEKAPRPEEVETFMAMLDAAGIEIEAGGLIDLWGGEPLLYWSVIERLVPALRARFGYGVRLSIFTNGVLLTEARGEFLLRCRVSVVISHDAQGFSLRDHDDPLKDPVIKSRWLDFWQKSLLTGVPLTFFSVIQPCNCDLFAIRRFFDENFAPGVHFEVGGTPSETEALPADCLLSRENVVELCNSSIRVMQTPENEWQGLRRRVCNLMGRLIHRVPVSGIRYHCNCVDEQVLCVTLKGDVISCQNRLAKNCAIGRLESLEQVRNPFFRHWSQRRHCPDCLVLSSCKGGCPDLSEAGFERCCTNEGAFHYAVFCAAWHEITGTVIEAVSPTPAFFRPRTVLIREAA